MDRDNKRRTPDQRETQAGCDIVFNPLTYTLHDFEADLKRQTGFSSPEKRKKLKKKGRDADTTINEQEDGSYSHEASDLITQDDWEEACRIYQQSKEHQTRWGSYLVEKYEFMIGEICYVVRASVDVPVRIMQFGPDQVFRKLLVSANKDDYYFLRVVEASIEEPNKISRTDFVFEKKRSPINQTTYNWDNTQNDPNQATCFTFNGETQAEAQQPIQSIPFDKNPYACSVFRDQFLTQK